MQLTTEQETAKNKIIEFLLNDTDQEMILQGHAGTGKSTIILAIIDEYNQMMKLSEALSLEKRSWVICATTNKACEALLEKGIKANTVHSTFGLTVKDELTGYFNKPFKGIYVIDECSYLNYEQFTHIRTLLPKAKIIYVGDKNQLTPVGLNHSPVYYADIPMVELKETIRQQNAPLIDKYCGQLREAITNNLNIPDIIYGKDIVYLDKDSFDKKILANASDFTDKKVLALKNTTVQKYNRMISKDIQVGDVLVNNSYHIATQLANNAYVTVKEIYGEQKVLGAKVLSCQIYANGHGYLNIYIPLSSRGLATAYRNAKSSNNWLEFNKIIDLRQTYAQTIHKSQGSTYKEVFVYLDDLNSIETKKEINRLLYVAFSRATDKVYVTGEIQ